MTVYASVPEPNSLGNTDLGTGPKSFWSPCGSAAEDAPAGATPTLTESGVAVLLAISVHSGVTCPCAARISSRRRNAGGLRPLLRAQSVAEQGLRRCVRSAMQRGHGGQLRAAADAGRTCTAMALGASSAARARTAAAALRKRAAEAYLRADAERRSCAATAELLAPEHSCRRVTVTCSGRTRREVCAFGRMRRRPVPRRHPPSWGGPASPLRLSSMTWRCRQSTLALLGPRCARRGCARAGHTRQSARPCSYLWT